MASARASGSNKKKGVSEKVVPAHFFWESLIIIIIIITAVAISLRTH